MLSGVTMELSKYIREFELCVKCSFCQEDPITHLPICPEAERFGFESYRPSGLMELARALAHRNIGLSEGLAKRFYSCLTCGACDKLCYSLTGKRPLNLFLETRRVLVKSGFGPMPGQLEATVNVLSTSNPYGKPKDQRFKWVKEAIPNKAEIVYFAGCTPSYYFPEQAQSTLKVLKAAGIKFAIMPNERCCGYTTIMTGQDDAAMDIVTGNVKYIKETGAKTLLTSCAMCYKIFNQDYFKLAGEKMDFEVTHTSLFFNDLVNENKLKLKKPISETITYHDPCNLGRLNNVYDEPRNLIEQIPKTQLVEMERNRGSAWCCGAGGGVKFAFPDFANWTAIERLKEAQSTGAKLLVSACPECELNFMDSLKTIDKKIKIQDVNQILAMSL